MNARYLTRAGVIAAAYAALTLALAPISYGQVQLRVAEALMLLPAFSAPAVPGLFVGCAIANSIGAMMGVTLPLDILFGSVATLIAAVLTRAMRRLPFYVYMLPAVVVNGAIVGAEISVLYGLPLLVSMGYVALGEAISCYVIGYPLSKAAKKLENLLN